MLRSACAHEHVTENPVCPGCAAELHRLAGTLICGPCNRAAVRHECAPRIVVEWAEGYRHPEPVTVVQEVIRA
jgi:predicted amidophosphoribosyltransferase